MRIERTALLGRGLWIMLALDPCADNPKGAVVFVRIARFEGADSGNLDERIEEVKRRMEGPAPEGMERPAGMKRAMMLVDRESGDGASVIFAEDEESLRAVDAFMNKLTPPAGGGRRATVEMYEVAVDAEMS